MRVRYGVKWTSEVSRTPKEGSSLASQDVSVVVLQEIKLSLRL